MSEQPAPPTAGGQHRRTLGEALRYVVVGSFNSILDLALFSLFAVVVGLPPVVANVLSTCITLCVSFFLNHRFVFKSDRTGWKVFIPFVAVTLVSGLLIQSAVIWGVIHLAGIVVPTASSAVVAPVSKVCAMGVGMISNFLGYRLLFHGPSRPGRDAQGPSSAL